MSFWTFLPQCYVYKFLIFNVHYRWIVTFKGERVKKWKGEKMATPFNGERVKRWKGEKMAAPFKGERVKKWKGEKMAAPFNLLIR